MKISSLFIATGIAAATLSMAPAAHAGAQQERMKQCNAQAAEKALKGDERKAFMKTCLSSKTESMPATTPAKPVADKAPAAAGSAATSQQDKMKSCNKQAGEKALHGEERKKFMSSCLKG